MNKKVVVLGGGTGLSTLLRGLKQFPVDIKAIVAVSDDGSSTGRLREEFNTPAVGDIRQVLIALSETEPLVENLLNYRFNTTSDLNGHAVGNLILTAMSNITGNLSVGIESLSKVFNLKGKLIPLTDENVVLVGHMSDGEIIEGEHHITEYRKKIEKVSYKTMPTANDDAIEAIMEADLVILSMGSLYTSIIPNLLIPEMRTALKKTPAKIMYICNMMTQPGETDNFKVSDHVKILNSYLRDRELDIIMANNSEINDEMIERYSYLEQKERVIFDRENLKEYQLIEDNFVTITNNMIRHDGLKVSLRIFEYLLKGDE
ncbi:MAG: YvcK family protein [Bacilli bacterium]|nr:YvcK family protein [Bacilli bacterium]